MLLVYRLWKIIDLYLRVTSGGLDGLGLPLTLACLVLHSIPGAAFALGSLTEDDTLDRSDELAPADFARSGLGILHVDHRKIAGGLGLVDTLEMSEQDSDEGPVVVCADCWLVGSRPRGGELMRAPYV